MAAARAYRKVLHAHQAHIMCQLRRTERRATVSSTAEHSEAARSPHENSSCKAWSRAWGVVSNIPHISRPSCACFWASSVVARRLGWLLCGALLSFLAWPHTSTPALRTSTVSWQRAAPPTPVAIVETASTAAASRPPPSRDTRQRRSAAQYQLRSSASLPWRQGVRCGAERGGYCDVMGTPRTAQLRVTTC